MEIPAISFVIVTNGPVLIAGSIFARKNKKDAVEPIKAAMLTAKTIPIPTTFLAVELIEEMAERLTRPQPRIKLQK